MSFLNQIMSVFLWHITLSFGALARGLKLVDVLQRVALHPAKNVLDLTPRVWKDKFADTPLASDVQQHRNQARL
ncbi:transposase [Alteromonas mediterranea U4]|nr:transposase [Alteromonas mediterranea U4]